MIEQWEYKTANVFYGKKSLKGSIDSEGVDNLGSQGWEAYSVQRLERDLYKYHFKRRIYTYNREYGEEE